MTDQNTPKAKSPFQRFLEHQSNAAQETGKALNALIPPEFKEHSKKAQEEFLRSFKVLIDGAQESINTELEKAKAAREKAKAQPKDESGPSTTGKSKVKVEVN
jgi:hypothetical protein